MYGRYLFRQETSQQDPGDVTFLELTTTTRQAETFKSSQIASTSVAVSRGLQEILNQGK